MFANPIIMKEFLQAGRQARTYVFRAGLVALAAFLVGPRLWESLRWYGQDWRQISRLSRAVFETLAWFQILTLPTISFLLCSMTLREEWNNRTIEVLCASPLSRFQIVYGKFVASVGKLALCALALLPIMALLLHLGRVPRQLAFGAFGAIVTAVLLLGALGLLQAALYRPGRHGWMTWFVIIVPYFLLIFLAAILTEGDDVLVAALPPFAMMGVIKDRGPSGMSGAAFAATACAINTGVALLALLLAPRVFAASLARHHEPTRGSPGHVRRFRNWIAGSRRPWDDEEAGRRDFGPILFFRNHPRWAAAIAPMAGGLLCYVFEFRAVPWNPDADGILLGAAAGLLVLGFLRALISDDAGETHRAMLSICRAYRFFGYAVVAVAAMLAFLLYAEVGSGYFAVSAVALQDVALLLLAAAAPALGAIPGAALRRLGVRLPPKPDPFVWQEKGGPTVALRRLPWAVYAVIFLCAACFDLVEGDWDVLGDDDFYFTLLMVGLAMFGVLSLFYGVAVFSREKSRRRAEALLLTGNPPWRFVRAKIRALYAALWLPLFSIPVLILLIWLFGGFRYFDWDDEGFPFAFLIAQGVLFGPALCAVIGMAFGLASRGMVRAVLGLLSSPGWAFLFFCVLGFCFETLDVEPDDTWWLFALGFAAAAWAVVRLPRRLTSWHLGLSLALQFWFVVLWMVGAQFVIFEDCPYEELIFSVAGSAATWLAFLCWLRVVLKIFEPGMAGNPVSLRRSRKYEG